MGTVIEYLAKYGKYTFGELPMTEVDSLALCQLSYLKFDGMVPEPWSGQAPAVLKELTGHPDYEKLFADVRFEKNNRALFEGMHQSRRFGNMELSNYVNIVEKEWETQFSALTCTLNDGTHYIAFRGTDETI